MLEPSIYSISFPKRLLQTVDAGSRLDKGRLRVIPHVHREPRSHGVLGRPPGALEVSALQSDLGYVRVMEGVPDLLQNLPRGGPEVHGG